MINSQLTPRGGRPERPERPAPACSPAPRTFRAEGALLSGVFCPFFPHSHPEMGFWGPAGNTQGALGEAQVLRLLFCSGLKPAQQRRRQPAPTQGQQQQRFGDTGAQNRLIHAAGLGWQPPPRTDTRPTRSEPVNTELEALLGEFGELPRFLEIPPGPAAPPGWGGLGFVRKSSGGSLEGSRPQGIKRKPWRGPAGTRGCAGLFAGCSPVTRADHGAFSLSPRISGKSPAPLALALRAVLCFLLAPSPLGLPGTKDSPGLLRTTPPLRTLEQPPWFEEEL